ncbi:uncharacterized protein FRV6_16644 [Fusarium oxysporum]|uniref:Uncharacterized protein n=1 Tax=Fusarium oxysporum TaxID=5507 RepID=A0A2H3UB60_FUSOX|nr:uncharacterized protein FRV6_16644 [Fusarium oxysporum]
MAADDSYTAADDSYTAADDSYTAADERARAARRAGLQAKKDEQPANTARSYAAKQREWKARSPGRRPLFSPLPLSPFFT